MTQLCAALGHSTISKMICVEDGMERMVMLFFYSPTGGYNAKKTWN